MSGEDRPTTSSTVSPNDEASSGLPATDATCSSENNVEVRSTNIVCCGDASTRKLASLAYGALLFFVGVVVLVASKVDTDKKGTNVRQLEVYRYLTVLLFIAMIWMTTLILSKWYSSEFREKWLSAHIEDGQLLPKRLLVGVMFFGLGSSFMTMVEFLEFIAEYNCPSRDLTKLFYFISRTLFIYVQLYFFYKLSSSSEKVLIFSHFLLMHLIAVNLGTWIVTFVYDSAAELHHDPKQHSSPNETHVHNSESLFMARHWGVLIDSHANGTENKTNCTDTVKRLSSTAETMEPYLYTFTMEYCLISAGLLLNAWLSLRCSTPREMTGSIAEQDNGGVPGQADCGAPQDADGSRNRLKQRHADQHKDRKGYKSLGVNREGHKGIRKRRESLSDVDAIDSDEGWQLVDAPGSEIEVSTLWRFGFILGLVYIPVFTAIVFNLMFSDDEHQDLLIYIGMQFFFFLSILIATVCGNRELAKQEKGKTHGQVDSTLLSIALVGVFFLDILIVIASICEAKESPTVALFLIFTNSVELFCSVTFTLFVRKALERKIPEHRNEAVTISASRVREIVSFLFMLNVCFWAMYTFEVKRSDRVVGIVVQFYTENVWFYLSHFAYPLAIFFHFHGAVCMVEILNLYSISRSLTMPTSSVSVSVSQPGLQI